MANKKINIIYGLWLVCSVVWLSTFLVGLVDSPHFVSTVEGSELKACFLDVGQGDAIVFRDGNGSTVLVDGGPDLTVLSALSVCVPWYERHIDMMVLTHPDTDHLFGLIEVLKRFQVDRVLVTGVNDDMPAYGYFNALVVQEGAQVIASQYNMQIEFSGMTLKVIYPESNLSGRTVSNRNDASIVVMVQSGEVKFLLTGDLPLAGEEILMRSLVDLQADVLKAGHHGSKTSSGIQFLQAVDPDYVVISAGKDNPYGHPHYRVVRAVDRVGAELLRTDMMGTIVFKTDGMSVWTEE